MRARIVRDGPVRFDDYVELALYEPGVGFFASGRGAGRGGRDFLTSPEVGPLFGAVVARALDRWWREAGRPQEWHVVDVGAGRGTLARSIRRAHPDCSSALRLTCVERTAPLWSADPDGAHSGAPALASTAVPDGAGEAGGAERWAELDDLGTEADVVLANEVLDNIAFRLLEARGGGWADVHVGVDDRGRLTEVVVPTDDGPTGVQARPGARIPWQPKARRAVSDWRRVASGGRVVAFDYCSSTAELARRRPDEWLRTYAGHRRGADVLVAPGAQDLTAEVCLDQLPPASEAIGQAAWLVRHGIDELVAEGRRTWADRAAIGDLAALEGRSRVAEAEALTDPEGLGAFTVLAWPGSDTPST